MPADDAQPSTMASLAQLNTNDLVTRVNTASMAASAPPLRILIAEGMRVSLLLTEHYRIGVQQLLLYPFCISLMTKCLSHLALFLVVVCLLCVKCMITNNKSL